MKRHGDRLCVVYAHAYCLSGQGVARKAKWYARAGFSYFTPTNLQGFDQYKARGYILWTTVWTFRKSSDILHGVPISPCKWPNLGCGQYSKQISFSFIASISLGYLSFHEQEVATPPPSLGKSSDILGILERDFQRLKWQLFFRISCVTTLW